MALKKITRLIDVLTFSATKKKTAAICTGIIAAIITACGVVVFSLRPALFETLVVAVLFIRSETVYAGSVSCRECHEDFYKLWSTSFHGTTMRKFMAVYENRELPVPDQSILIGDTAYSVRIVKDRGFLIEQAGDSTRTYLIEFAVGGKYVFFLLVDLGRGFLQTAPIAYNVRTKQWYNMTQSAVRHFGIDRLIDEPIYWKDRLWTFNTSCYSCHISQLSTNYSPESDSYATQWREPGINCETCHGPGEEHNRACRRAGKNAVPKDLKIISTSKLTPQQNNAICAPCHAKMSPITSTFMPGDRYFDHYDLSTLEDHDFYPDGRDLGENYTYTSWLMAPCLKSGIFDCNHCHTPSGRYRFHADSVANNACMPCHYTQVRAPAAHTHHKAASPASRCIACHMPMTEFGRMHRSDHSMRPPMPAATRAFGSPNACNICHNDSTAAWADSCVRDWRTRDYQAPVIAVGRLIQEARNEDWHRVDEMYAYIRNPQRDEIFSNSLIRLLINCPDKGKWDVFINALSDQSPLIRSSAATALAGRFTPPVIAALVKACRDDYRLVRVRAAFALAGVGPGMIAGTADSAAVACATEEFIKSTRIRLDNFASHLNIGNYYYTRGEYSSAASAFEKSALLRTRFIPPLINASMAYARLKNTKKAEYFLRRALSVEPENTAVNLNLGLLLGEQGRFQDAEKAYRTAFAADSLLDVAAYNLGIIIARNPERIDEAVDWCRIAARISPHRPDYAYTYAYYLLQQG